MPKKYQWIPPQNCILLLTTMSCIDLAGSIGLNSIFSFVNPRRHQQIFFNFGYFQIVIYFFRLYETHRDLISPSQYVQTILCWLSGSSTDQSVLFKYTQTALNADAMFELRLHDCNKGLLPTLLLFCESNTESRHGSYQRHQSTLCNTFRGHGWVTLILRQRSRSFLNVPRRRPPGASPKQPLRDLPRPD